MQRVKTIWKKGRKSYWIKASSLTLLNRLLVTGFGFLNFYVLIRLLPQADYGLWMLFVSVTTVIELIKAGFIRNPLIRFSLGRTSQKFSGSAASTAELSSPAVATAERSSRVEVLSASFLLNLLLTFLIAVLLLAFSGSLSLFWGYAGLQDLFSIYIITLFLLVPLHHFDYVQQANLSFKGSTLGEFTRQFTFFVCLMSFYLTQRPIDLVTLAFFQAVAVGFSSLASFFFARRYLTFTFRTTLPQVRTLFRYGKYTFGTSVSAMLMRNTDTWMLARMTSPLSVALYNPALRIANLLEIPALTLASVLFPKLSQQFAEKGQGSARYLYEKSVGTILCSVLPMALLVLVFAEPITVFIAGEDYIATAPVLRITVLYSFLLPFNRQFGVTLDAIGKAKINFLFVLRDALLNVVLNYIFITRYGLIGAAYGTATTYLIAVVANQVYLHKNLQVSLLRIFYYTASGYRKVYHTGLSVLQKKT